jgi:autoinducer 2-degrading protein
VLMLRGLVARSMSSAVGVSSAVVSGTSPARPFTVVVSVEIARAHLEEFKRVMEHDAVESRKEPGCIRFDVLQDQAQDNKFVFYEIYKSAEDVAFHKKTPHFAKWAAFKTIPGAVLSYSAQPTWGLFMQPKI